MPETQDSPFAIVKHPKTEVKEMDESEDDCADIPDEQSMGQVTVKIIPDEPEELKVAPKRKTSNESFYSANASCPEKSNAELMSRVSDAVRVKMFSPNGNLSETAPINRSSDLSPAGGRRSPNLRY